MSVHRDRFSTKKKYNLALIPMTENKYIVDIARTFCEIADKYLLGENSLPHLTLYQFETEESKIKDTWDKVSQRWKEKPIELTFAEFSCITFDDNIYWVSLLPNHTEVLYKMHEKIANIIEQPIKKNFDPHITLINTKNKEYEKEVEKFSILFNSFRDDFILKLGKCDEVGQFTEIIY